MVRGMRFGYALSFGLLLLSIAVLQVPVGAVADSGSPSLSSSPPDLTPYSRPVVSDDLRVGTAALTAFVRDTVISNTDATLRVTDTFPDGEPSIAVNPANPNEIVILAFSGGWGATAPLWHSLDGGATWTKQPSIPLPPGRPGAFGCPCDQAPDYGRSNALFAAFLAEPDVLTGSTSNPASAAAWQWNAPGGVTQKANIVSNDSDQPWLLVNRDPTNAAQDNTYVAYDDFAANPVTMRVSVSTGSNPPNFIRDVRSGNSLGFVNPGHRLAKDPRNGTMYSLFQQTSSNDPVATKNVNFLLNRSTDGGQTWTLNGNANGIIVANGDSNQPWPKFGGVNALLGGVLHAAVDPTNGDVYYVHAARDSVTGNNRLRIVHLTTNSAGTMSQVSAAFVTGQIQAALPSVAVNSQGTVGVLYTSFDGTSASGFPMFTAHLATSTDQGQTFSDLNLLTFNSSALNDCPTSNPNCTSRQRVLGDYQQLKSVGTVFYGTFTGNGAALGRAVSNMDAMFFKVDANRNSSLALNGVDGFAEAPNAADLNLTSNWTLETWFKDENPNGFNHDFATLIAKGDQTAERDSPYFVSIGFKRLYVGLKSAGTTFATSYDLRAGGVDASKWHHLAASFAATTRTLTLYLDGAPVQTVTLGGLSSGNTLPLDLGRSGAAGGKYFHGKLDDTRLWNVVRSASDIAGNFMTELTSAPPGLVANWKYDDGSGPTATDSADSHDATLHGGASFSTDVHP